MRPARSVLATDDLVSKCSGSLTETGTLSNIPDPPNTSERGSRQRALASGATSSDAGPTRPVKTTARRLQQARPPRS
jgi:hypothetical protein